ncbi:MAG: hypothetical protein R6V19_17485, partial [Armatimonadota bacterium]
DGLLEVAGQLGPAAVLGGYFLISMLLTNVISNQATAALLAPLPTSCRHCPSAIELCSADAQRPKQVRIWRIAELAT